MTNASLIGTESRADVKLPGVLALLAGITDVTSWILLGGLFTAHITGNLVLVAADVVTGTRPHLAVVLALPVFVVTVVAATAVARRLAGRDGRMQRLLLGAQALLLAAAAVLSFTGTASASPEGGLALAIGLCAVCAMATQNAYLHLAFPHAPTTSVMTGNLAVATIAVFDLIASRGKSATALTHWRDTWPLLAGFIGGCLVGALASTLFGDHAAVVPATLAVAVFVGIAVKNYQTSHA
ncbi:uncharacterized membrane protein YoaK (UPF0700 family) [Conyzicola nivalis]|uniref:Uncharacterized membrane protein YoaK (UPF0700 family) n=1 Tax=Conyzicola nivalis TaxID=1477021 RepID=A0ABV2QSR4_9MICO